MEALLDDLSNWYVRRSRRRFWKSEADEDKAAAYATLYIMVVQMAKLLAPFIPFTAEVMYQNLVRGVDADAPLSVHHNDWPTADAASLDKALLDRMRLAINVASLGRSARSAANFKLRQPLAKARVNVGTQQEQRDLMALADVLTEEINVKEIEVVSEVGKLVKYKLMPNNRILGPKLGPLFPKVKMALAEMNQAEAATILHSGGSLVVEIGDQRVELTSEEVLVQTESRGGLAVASDKGITVAVDTELTPELIREGYARDIVRQINILRKDAGLSLDDRIHLFCQAEGVVAAAIADFAEYIRQETLALSLTLNEPGGGDHEKTLTIDSSEVIVALSKA